jgi:hypothetical protein
MNCQKRRLEIEAIIADATNLPPQRGDRPGYLEATLRDTRNHVAYHMK